MSSIKDIITNQTVNIQRVSDAICKKYETSPMSAEDWSMTGGIQSKDGQWIPSGEEGGMWVPIHVYVTLEDIESAEIDPGPDEYPCPVHAGEIHGGEAADLREGIEKILQAPLYEDYSPQRAAEEVLDMLRTLLDRVDARDNLAHDELTGKLKIMRKLAERAEEFKLGESPSLMVYKDRMVRASDIIDVLDGKITG